MSFSALNKIILAACLIVAFLLPNFQSLALTPSEEREALEKELRELEELITQYEQDINKTEQEKNTLQNQISVLTKKIQNLNYQIYQSNLVVGDLKVQIKDTETSIVKTSLEVEVAKERLAEILRTLYEEDQKSLVEILLMEASVSDFFNNLVALDSLNSKSQELLESIKNLKTRLEDEKVSLDGEKQDLERLVVVQTLQKQESAKVKQQQEGFLKLTEAEYQKQLQEKGEVEKKAAQIRARIFELIGVPEAPTFGEALEIARHVETVTGVRPAFLLAILTQESNIGKNVGQCYLKNPDTGAGVVIYNGNTISSVMKPSRDVSPFLTITRELGRDPFSTPVSCPMSYGWGGAMGPAQFIPSTWVLYKEEIKRAIGKAPDPWSIKDAFMAAAFYLADFGAAKQTYDGEFNAAVSYFAGPSWYKSRYSNIYRRDYGYPVMSLAAGYTSDIKTIE